MPTRFKKPDKVLKLKKTLYGLKQSLRSFWKYLTKAMEACDPPHLFVGDKVLCISYVDDILFWAKDEADIIELGNKLCAQGLLLEQEDDAAGSVEVFLTKNDVGLIEMKQTGLIDSVIEILGLDSCMYLNGDLLKTLCWFIIGIVIPLRVISATAL